MTPVSAKWDRKICRQVLSQLARGSPLPPHAPPRVPEIWGHRGAKAHAPENTLPAFQLALDLGACGIELDVHLALCRTPVVVHDERVDRTTNGSGAVAELTAPALAALQPNDAMPSPPKLTRAPLHEGIPSLAEVLRMLPNGTRLNVELKGPSPRSAGLEMQVLDCIQPHLYRLEIWVSSFHPAQLWLCRQLMPAVRLGLLVEGRQNLWLRSGVSALAIRPEAFHPPACFVDAEVVKLAQCAGMRVHVWGVRGNADVSRLAEMGVDAVLVDDVSEAVRQLSTVIARRS